MSGLLNKLTGHHNTDQTVDANQHGTHDKHHHGQTTTTQTQTTTSNSALHNQSINQQQTLGGMNNPNAVATNNPYGASTATSTQRTGAAYTDAGVANVNNNQTLNQQALNQQRPAHEDAITRSEEQLRLSKARVETGTAELNKYVSVDHVEKQIPVTRQRLVIERFPINETNIGAFSNAAIGEQHFVTEVYEDRVAAVKEVVPIERIRLAKEIESHVETVGADLRKEHVDYAYQSFQGKNDDGLAHDVQAKRDFAYDTHRATDSSYSQAGDYNKPGGLPAGGSSLPSQHGVNSGMHAGGTHGLSDKIGNVGKTGHAMGIGGSTMAGASNPLSNGTGAA